MHFKAAASSGKCPRMRALTLDRVRAADDLAALDVEGEEGLELGPGVRPQLHDRRIFLTPRFLELQEPLGGSVLAGRGVDGPEGFGYFVPVLTGGVTERVPQQVKPSRNNPLLS